MSEEIKNYIKNKRPNITISSLKTYESIIRNLYNNMDFDNTNGYDLNKFETESIKVLKHLKDMVPNKRKTILSALVVITNNKDYRDLMLDDIKEYNKEQSKQTKSKTQNENWIDKEELEDISTSLKKNANLIYKKELKSNCDLQDIQNYIILSLYNGEYIPPRRSKDYVNFKIKNIDKSVDNYMNKNEFIFNSYKTAKTYGQQKVQIPKELKAMITKWIKINPTDYLLFDSSLNQLSNVKLNQRLNKIFDKKASVNQLRHTYLTEKYGSMINTKNELKDDMKLMGSSIHQEVIYIKK